VDGDTRTAVVVVHGMGEQRPLDTINGFVKTGLEPIADPKRPNGQPRIYYSRPALLTKSYEARRLLAIERKSAGAVVQTQTEFYEYHWSYLMTGNKFGDLLPTTTRLLLRQPRRVPAPLRVMWAGLWIVLIAFTVYIWWLVAHNRVTEFSVKGIISAVLPNVLAAAVVVALVFWVSGWLTSTFVDVVRYLDTSPRSYEVRRAIRGGMVDLLTAIHEDGRYSRIIVVAHSLGGFIAYDAMSSLWNETKRGGHELEELKHLQTAANALPRNGSQDTPTSEQLNAFRAAQFSLWEEMRRKQVPWLITDFITVGTPMYFADLLLTRNRSQFDMLRKRSELPQCPPRSDSETVDGSTPPELSYGWRGQARLVSGSPFAVVRWTNFWFPTEFGLFGDWFCGPLRPLFGCGIDERPIRGNRARTIYPCMGAYALLLIPRRCRRRRRRTSTSHSIVTADELLNATTGTSTAGDSDRVHFAAGRSGIRFSAGYLIQCGAANPAGVSVCRHRPAVKPTFVEIGDDDGNAHQRPAATSSPGNRTVLPVGLR
jgi:hypothetical protein